MIERKKTKVGGSKQKHREREGIEQKKAESKKRQERWKLGEQTE